MVFGVGSSCSWCIELGYDVSATWLVCCGVVLLIRWPFRIIPMFLGVVDTCWNYDRASYCPWYIIEFAPMFLLHIEVCCSFSEPAEG